MELLLGGHDMNFHHLILAGAIFAGVLMKGPAQATAMAGLGLREIVSAHSSVTLAQFGPYKYGGYGAPYPHYRRPFLYTYPPPAYRPYRYYRYPHFYYYPPLYYFRY
jgi:hypothetical protein